MRRWMGYALAGFAALALGFGVWILDIANRQPLDLDRIYGQPQTTVIYDVYGRQAGSLYAEENRRYVALADIPQHVIDGFIAAEDARFYSHRGFDLTRIFGALWHDIKTMSLSQGASTITQQLIKLTHLSGEKTLARKVQELILSVQLEKHLSKAEILEAYLNTVYFGNGAYGIEAAAQAYFSIPASELTLSQGALLAGVIKSPSNYAPHLNMENAILRRNLVLNCMLESGCISPQAHAQALSETVGLNMTPAKNTQATWYLDAVLAETAQVLKTDAESILSQGLHIYTALDPSMQATADALFENGANFPDPAEDHTPVQAAFIAMDVQNGEIRAVVGGRSYEVARGLNRATDILRSPGSAIKPLSTYAAAIEIENMLPTSAVYDVAREFSGGYAPGNAGGRTYGKVTLREALSRSLNIATVDLAETIGIHRVRDMIERFGLPLSQTDVNLSLALGSMTYGVSPAQLCGAYCTLANGGLQVKPHTVRTITDAAGKTIYHADTTQRQIIRPETAFLMTDMLKTAARTGSAKALSIVKRPVAAKTGTVSETAGGTRDIWTAAYTPQIAVCTWMGFDQPDAQHAMPDSAGGSGHPARLCAAFLNAISPQLSDRDFEIPSGLRAVSIDKAALSNAKQVLLAAENTPESYRTIEYFYPSNLPSAVSQLWDAPLAVDDLTLLSEPGDVPAIAFTSRQNHAEYLVLRKTGNESEIAAVLSAPEGDVIVWADTNCPTDTAATYSVLPRHRLLYENGTLLTGMESTSVQYAPRSFFQKLFG